MLHRAEETPNSVAQPLLQTLPGGTQASVPANLHLTCPSARAYFNLKMSQRSSGLSKPNLFLTSCFVTHWSPSAPHHLAVPTEGHNPTRGKGQTCGTVWDNGLSRWRKYQKRLCHTWSGIFCVK